MRHKVLISGDWGTGKSVLALAYSQVLGPNEDMLVLDYEDGAEFYVAPLRDQVDPSKCIFYARRLLAPSVYEVRALVQKVIDPERPGRELRINHKPLDPTLLSKEVKTVMSDIGSGKLHLTAMVVDTVTRLCDLTAAKVFGEVIDRKESQGKDGIEAAEKVSQLLWAKTKDDLSSLFYEIITEAQLSLILTSWSKPRFDKNTRRSTEEMIADVLKNVHAFVSLGIMLEPHPDSKVKIPRARVFKSRLVALPRGSLLEQATWSTILAAEPRFAQETKEEASSA